MITLLLALATDVTGVITLNGKPVKDAVVWFASESGSKPGKAEIVQKGKQFLPHVLVVTSGSRVSFPNRDDLFHNVFAEYRAKKFDLGMYPKGQTRDVVFDKTGVVSVLCNVHSNMSAYVVVVDTPYFAKTDAKGAFTVKGLTGASAKFEAWHETGATFTGNWNGGPLKINLKR